MTPAQQIPPAKPAIRVVLTLAIWLLAPQAHSQSACSSDNQPTPTTLFERFINADCEACWRDAHTPAAPTGSLTVDWIVPGSQGEDAALAAAASSDAFARLDALHQTRPARQNDQTTAVVGVPGAVLRVAHGPAVSNYVGMSFTLHLPPEAALAWPLSGWVVLVENLPSGTEGSPLPRNLVRNTLQPLWNKDNALSNQDYIRLEEFRAMSLPEGTQPHRLQLLGWVEDAHGRVLTAARSTCPPEDKTEPVGQTR